MRSRLSIVTKALVLMSAAVFAHGATLAEFTGGTGSLNLSTYDGQAFLVLGSGSYTDITFNFFTPASSPYAVGTAYLFSTPYTGTPAALSSAPGYIGSAAASNGVYSFGTTMTLTAGSTYYLFADTLVPAGAIVGASLDTSQFYQADNANDNFGPANGSANFVVSGNPPSVGITPTPEPSSMLLLGIGLIASAALARASRGAH
jgi:PEP-CTERM motif-containing protein